MKIVIMTGSELRHTYFRIKIASIEEFCIVRSYCEGVEQSLESRLFKNNLTDSILYMHVYARSQSEKDFFEEFTTSCLDRSNPVNIEKGSINDSNIVNEIIDLNPDLLICYGSSIIKSKLLDVFKGRFLNVHLGLAPYYRGSGTNVWPLINFEPEYVGATFMHIDKGIDTGEIIHQIQADIFLGDNPHTIGNRLITKMTSEYIRIIRSFSFLTKEKQLISESKLYLRKDFDEVACNKLYSNFDKGMIQNFLLKPNKNVDIISNRGLRY
jgi:phosphoribosylglycinamide formyltransferase 1